MATYEHRGERWAYVLWRTPIRTPCWFDDNDGARTHGIWRPVHLAWAWMRSAGLIQLRKITDLPAQRQPVGFRRSA